MKELEKTKRISIAAMLSILVVITALLSYKRPKHIYTETTKDALEKITDTDYSIGLEKIDNPNYILIDLRNQYEFEKGHLKNAININMSEILSDTYSDMLTEIKEDGKIAILYATNPSNAMNTCMLLQQLGYDNLKILYIENSYDHNKLITKKVTIEKPNGLVG